VVRVATIASRSAGVEIRTGTGGDGVVMAQG
jgi:hypothetical protein